MAVVLLFLLLCGAGPLRAQATATLAELEQARDEAKAAHHDALVDVQAYAQAKRPIEARLQTATAAEARIEAEEGQGSALEAARQAKRRISNELVAVRRKLSAAQVRMKTARQLLIRAKWALTGRLLELVDRARNMDRPEQASRHLAAALEQMERLSKLERLEDPPPALFQPLEIDPDTPREELERHVEWCEALIEEARGRIAKVIPVERERERRVRHLDRLLHYDYAIPNLEETLARERAALDRAVKLRQTDEELIVRLDKEVRQVRALLQERDRGGPRPPEDEE